MILKSAPTWFPFGTLHNFRAWISTWTLRGPSGPQLVWQAGHQGWEAPKYSGTRRSCVFAYLTFFRLPPEATFEFVYPSLFCPPHFFTYLTCVSLTELFFFSTPVALVFLCSPTWSFVFSLYLVCVLFVVCQYCVCILSVCREYVVCVWFHAVYIMDALRQYLFMCRTYLIRILFVLLFVGCLCVVCMLSVCRLYVTCNCLYAVCVLSVRCVYSVCMMCVWHMLCVCCLYVVCMLFVCICSEYLYLPICCQYVVWFYQYVVCMLSVCCSPVSPYSFRILFVCCPCLVRKLSVCCLSYFGTEHVYCFRIVCPYFMHLPAPYCFRISSALCLYFVRSMSVTCLHAVCMFYALCLSFVCIVCMLFVCCLCFAFFCVL